MKERELFIAALAIADLVERDAFLSSACVEPGQKGRLEALLREEQGLGEFLEAPATGAPADSKLSLHPGSIVGPYALLEEIGEGGMGVVYLAEQLAPVRRQVAVKVIKPGMDNRQVIARFEAERQALALMEHPNIAGVLDAGATETGRPYFVMELVRGLPITEHCDAHRLDTEARLNLFIAVCRAIQHAHQKGVIHRDIKPSNVLVAIQDDKPVPKVIDFGIAKATDQRLTEKTFFTAHGQMIGTPAYMSPEQADLYGRDVDTRTDIYSLGVLLYELLTGRTPIDSERLRSAGFAEMQRLIRDEEPPRPSARLTTLADGATDVAECRATDPRRLSKLLAGDLDWILMKALEKDRERRYATPGAFALDVERFLRGEAIEARAPSAADRLLRFARRHRGAVLAVTLATTTLLAGTTVAIWQAVVAHTAKRGAEAAALSERNAKLKAQEKETETASVLGFVQDHIFAAARPLGQAGGLGKDIPLHEVLTASLPQVEKSFAGQPLVEARVRATLGNNFLFLGDAEAAFAQQRRAHDIYLGLLGTDDVRTLQSASDLGGCYRGLGDFEKARAIHEETLRRRRRVLGLDDPKTLESQHNLAVALGDLGKIRPALDLAEETLDARRKRLGPTHQDTLATMIQVSNGYAATDRAADALRTNVEALGIAESTVGPVHPMTLMIRNNLALDYADAQRFDDALKMQEETHDRCKAQLGEANPLTLTSLRNVAKALADLGRLEDAVAKERQALTLLMVKPGPVHPITLNTIYGLAIHLGSLERYEEALKWHRQALDGRKTKLGLNHRETLFSMWGVAANLIKLDRGSEALPIIDECLERAASDRFADWSDLADLRLQYGQKIGDAAACRTTAELWEKMNRADPTSLAHAARYRSATAGVILATDKTPEGERAASGELDRAMVLIHRAVDAGFRKAEDLKTLKGFAPLRGRAEFLELIAKLEAKPK